MFYLCFCLFSLPFSLISAFGHTLFLRAVTLMPSCPQAKQWLAYYQLSSLPQSRRTGQQALWQVLVELKPSGSFSGGLPVPLGLNATPGELSGRGRLQWEEENVDVNVQTPTRQKSVRDVRTLAATCTCTCYVGVVDLRGKGESASAVDASSDAFLCAHVDLRRYRALQLRDPALGSGAVTVSACASRASASLHGCHGEKLPWYFAWRRRATSSGGRSKWRKEA